MGENYLKPALLAALGLGSAFVLYGKLASRGNIARKKRANGGLALSAPDEAGSVPIVFIDEKGELSLRGT